MASTILHTIITPSAVIPTNFIQQNKLGTRTPVNFLKFMTFYTESISSISSINSINGLPFILKFSIKAISSACISYSFV